MNYRSRIESTATKSASKQRFKDVMLAYHDFRLQKKPYTQDDMNRLRRWQSERLIESHRDLYEDPQYHQGLKYLFSDLYSTDDIDQRDQDLERIFPKLTRYLPNRVIETVATVVELNLLTQELDETLLEQLNCDLSSMSHDAYCDAFRACDNQDARIRQIQLILETGVLLEKYAQNSAVQFGMTLFDGPAHRAGLGDLYRFIAEGFASFATMHNVSGLLKNITQIEIRMAEEIFAGKRNSFCGQ